MAFSIWIPGDGPVDSVLTSAGAGWALDPASVTAKVTPGIPGPTGEPGRMVNFDRRDGATTHDILAVDLELQAWELAIPKGDYWVGFWKTVPPTPETLERAHVSEGASVTLGGNTAWQVPIATKLPKVLRLNRETGQEYTAPLPQHEPFIRRTGEILEGLVSGEWQRGHRIVIPGGLLYAIEALAKNYRIDATLAEMLELFDDFACVEVAMITTELKDLGAAAAVALAEEDKSNEP